MRTRLDVEMVRRGLAASRSEAADLISAGLVTVSGAVADKPSRLVAKGDPVNIAGPAPRYVSRGGEKLHRALDVFEITISNRSVLDAGSSTGGFTDCSLQHGARRVAGFDVGRAQMHERLTRDERVVQRDGVNVRSITTADLPFPCSLLVADVSFISLTKVLPALLSVLSEEGGFDTPEALVLVKPQFEAGRREVSKGRGIITDPSLWKEACDAVAECFGTHGFEVCGVVESPIKGGDGNVEYLMYARRGVVGQTSGVVVSSNSGDKA
jgi:23S rRNA (cytidine1920-2'-O)/16S rRNA (cytidine1409-2'-O)-methyltransferase